MDSLEEADLYRSAIKNLIAETQDIGILDLIYKILIQTKNWKKTKSKTPSGASFLVQQLQQLQQGEGQRVSL